MANESSKELGPEDFERMAAELDSKGSVEVPDESPSAESQPDEGGESESHDDAGEAKPDEQPKPEEGEGEQVPEDKPETRESDYTKAQKDRARLDRNWENQQKIAEENRRKEAELAERERKLQEKERTPKLLPESDKDEKGYTAEDYERAHEQFLLEGNKEWADDVKARAQKLRTATHQRLWNAHVESIKKENPGIENPENPLHQASMKVLRDIPILNILPDGAVHALKIAKAEQSGSLLSGLQTENQKLKAEVKRLNSMLEVGGSGPHRIPSDREFEDLSPKDQERQLQRMAEEADRLGIA